MAALGWGPSAGRERQAEARFSPSAVTAPGDCCRIAIAPTQNVNDIPISIFRVPSTLVGCLKNGEVIVPL